MVLRGAVTPDPTPPPVVLRSFLPNVDVLNISRCRQRAQRNAEATVRWFGPEKREVSTEIVEVSGTQPSLGCNRDRKQRFIGLLL